MYYLDSNITFQIYNLFYKCNILINNYIGKTEICLNDNCNDNNDKIVFSGKKALSFTVSKQNNNISFNVIDNVVFNIQINYLITNNILTELFFDTGIQNNIVLPVGYYIKEIEYGGADINFYFNFDKNTTDFYNGNYISIRGYILSYQYITYLNSRGIIAHPKDETPIDGYFDLRTNNGLIVFDKEYIANKTKNIYYYIIIGSISSLKCSLEVNAYSKTSYSPIPMNKYISGSFDLLINNTIQSQKYYIQDVKNAKNNSYIIDFSSNYQNIELIFSDNINCLKTIIIGGVIKYYINTTYSKEFTENYIQVQINNTNKNIINNNTVYLQKAYYMLKYYKNNDDKNISQVIDISHNNNRTILILRYNNNKYKNEFHNYNISYFLKVYRKISKLKDELLNTTVQTSSPSFQILKIKQSLDKDCLISLEQLQEEEEFIASLFIRIENENDKEDKYFYSITFDFNTKNESKDNFTTFLKIVGLFLIIIIFILIIFILCYCRIKKKNTILKEKVEAITFSSGIDEEALNINQNKSIKKNEDYETTFI